MTSEINARVAFIKKILKQAGITYPEINPELAPMADVENWLYASQQALIASDNKDHLSKEFTAAANPIAANEYINKNFPRFFQKIYNQDVMPVFMKYGRTKGKEFSWHVSNLNVTINMRCLAITGLAHLQTKQKTLDIEAWLQASDRLSRAIWTKIHTEDHGFKNFKRISEKFKAHEASYITFNEFEIPFFIALQDEQYAFFKQL
ncbi:hypothetical protein H6G04_29980 [Calothrix membranacea FACHB-236]|nr:hypothetical protein [Calothrix membranacea FACHB-236]